MKQQSLDLYQTDQIRDLSIQQIQKLQHQLGNGNYFRQKVIACSSVIKNFDSWVESIDNEIKRLQERKRVTINKKQRLKSYLLQEMLKTDIQRIEEGPHRVSVRKSPPKVQVEEPDQIPGAFQEMEISYRINRTAILRHVKETGEVPSGCQVDQSEYIHIN